MATILTLDQSHLYMLVLSSRLLPGPQFLQLAMITRVNVLAELLTQQLHLGSVSEIVAIVAHSDLLT